MRHSSRILQIFAILSVAPAAAVAGGASGGGGTLSKIRSSVGSARGPSPITPVVGTARTLSPIRFGAEGRQRLAAGAMRYPFRGHSIASGYGDFGFVGAGLYGAGLGNGSGVYPPQAYGPLEGSDGNPTVLLAPPPACVQPQIIAVGRSAHVERLPAKRKDVRVVYGRPPCGSF